MSKRKGPEATIEREVCDIAESHGFLAWKFTSPNLAGVPDRMIVAPWGLVSFWEFKAPGKAIEPDSPQERRCKELASRGVLVVMCDATTKGEALLYAMSDPELYAAALAQIDVERQEALHAPQIITTPVSDSRH